MTKVPRVLHAEDLQILLDSVIANSHFEISGYLFRQGRGVAMGSPAAPPLCNLVATVEDFFWHQTMTSLQCRLPDFGVIWHERYVDNRFTLLRSSADPSAILDNFLSLEFYRPPVMLETQHDQKVHPSQTKGVRSANDDLYTWSSRSWLIVRGAQPWIQQRVGLQALKRIYEAKGFDPAQLRDVWNRGTIR